MLNINKTSNGSEYTVTLEGRLDTNTSPSLEKELTGGVLDAAATLIFDMASLSYISSAGLRVLLVAQKAMNAKKGSMIIRNCNAELMEIFDVTGFSDILHIE